MSDVSGFASSELILQVKDLGKIYARRTSDTRRRLGAAAWRALFHLNPRTEQSVRNSQFWAVRNVSFDLHRGEAIGIIGLNGSGKTTLLRMLAGQIHPDAGEVTVQGSTAAMIDLQAGFQPSASGMENIFLRAAALGFSRKETEAKLDQIVAFSELDNAIHAPMSTYSAGMRMRLAFSVMAIVSPDILFIDEVLAVGDFRFRQKCLAKVREMRQRSAFVFVSHSMDDISRFCDRVIVLHKGRVHFEGPADQAIDVYQSLETESPTAGVDQKLEAAMGPVFENETALTHVEHFWCDQNGEQTDRIPFDRPFSLRLRFKAQIDIRHLIIGIPVWAINSHYVTGLSTQINSDRFDVKMGATVDIVLDVGGGYFNPGTLKSMLTILDGPEFLYRQENPDLIISSASHPTWGSVTVPHSWRRLDHDEPPAHRLKLVQKS